MTASIEQLKGYIADKERQISYLEGRYGQGVRPSFVGEEIGLLVAQIREAEKVIAEVKELNAGEAQ
jgi:hypothetical protein